MHCRVLFSCAVAGALLLGSVGCKCLPINCSGGGGAGAGALRLPQGLSVGAGTLRLQNLQRLAIPSGRNVHFCMAYEVKGATSEGSAALVAVDGKVAGTIDYNGEKGRKDARVDLTPYLTPGEHKVAFVTVVVNQQGVKTRAARVMADRSNGRTLVSHRCFETKQTYEVVAEEWTLDVQ